MELMSVNRGIAQEIPDLKPSRSTGIDKRPVKGPVPLTVQGLVGDVVCDTKHHGGVDQAIYVYGTLDYAWWDAQLAQVLAPGTFGENLTITDLASAQISIGDRLHIGTGILEVTAPRIPCVTLARRMGDPNFVKRFRAAERPGVYCRVIREGRVQAGDRVSLERGTGETITVIELFRDAFAPTRDPATIRRHLAAPVSMRIRAKKEQQLREIAA